LALYLSRQLYARQKLNNREDSTLLVSCGSACKSLQIVSVYGFYSNVGFIVWKSRPKKQGWAVCNKIFELLQIEEIISIWYLF